MTVCSWSELTRKLELWVEIHELSEQGEYVPVEVSPKPEVPSGGVFQLRQVSAHIYLIFTLQSLTLLALPMTIVDTQA